MRLTCALALLLLGLAHQPPAAIANQPENFDAYRLPDGSLPSLCVTITGKDSGEAGHKIHNSGCEACRISATALLSSPHDISGMPIAYIHSSLRQAKTEAFRRQLYPPNTGPRAPPVFPIVA